MGSQSTTGRAIAFYTGALALALLSAFFVFYALRLLYVTRALSAIRPGGQGAYVGAVAFPLLALLLGWCAWRLLRAARRT
jgi:hypothetical protein